MKLRSRIAATTLCAAGLAAAPFAATAEAAPHNTGSLTVSGTEFHNGDTATFNYSYNGTGTLLFKTICVSYQGDGGYWESYWPTAPNRVKDPYISSDFSSPSPGVVDWQVNVPLTDAFCQTQLLVKQGNSMVANVTFRVNR